jgi:hypothetical protein
MLSRFVATPRECLSASRAEQHQKSQERRAFRPCRAPAGIAILRTVNAESHSSSDLLSAVLYGAARNGTVLSRHDLLFGDYVVTMTPPRSPRMPNGIECRATASSRAHVAIGRGRLTVGRIEITPGSPWNPVPSFPPLQSLPAGPEPQAGGLTSWMAAPDEAAGESLVAGYVAGLVLLHGQLKRAERIALRAAQRLTPIHATLLRHAARGEVPEPVHDLLVLHDPTRLLALSPAGMLWLRGLISAGLPLDLANVLAGPALQRLA